MKKKFTIIIGIIILIACSKVNAQTLDRYTNSVELAPKSETSKINVGNNFNSLSNYKDIAKYFEQETLKYISNTGSIKWPDKYVDLVMKETDLKFDTYYEEYKKDNLGTTEKEVRQNLTEFLKQNGNNVTMLYSYVPAELSARGITLYGGSSGSDYCCLDCDDRECFLRNKAAWYPLILEELVSIHKDDANGQKVEFNNISNNKPYIITDNGNVLEDGTYESLNKLKIKKSEYDKIMSGEETLNLYISSSHSPFSMDFFELLSNDTYTPFYITRHAYNKEGNEVELKNSKTAYYKNYETLLLDKSYIKDDSIYGLYLMQTGNLRKYNNGQVITGVNNNALDSALQQYNSTGIIYYYRFKINLEIVNDTTNEVVVNTKSDKDIKENNAKIYLEDEVIDVSNKKSWSEGRIYVELDKICKYIDCDYKYDKSNKSYKVNYYPIKDNKNIVYSLKLNENNNIFESVLKVYNEVYDFKNKTIDAAPFYDENKLYVPIRFLLEGLGAQVDYVPTNGQQPEEVRIYFNVDNFINTTINNKKIESDEIDISGLTQITFKQQYLLDNDKKYDMNYIKLLFNEDNKLKICDNKADEACDLNIIDNKKVEFKKGICLDNLNLYIVNKYNDYPYIKFLKLNNNCEK